MTWIGWDDTRSAEFLRIDGFISVETLRLQLFILLKGVPELSCHGALGAPLR